MPKPHLRTRSRRRKTLNLPSGGGLTTHYKRAKVKAPNCTQCGRTIFGLPIKAPSKLARLSKSKKRPQRMFGGQLCHKCLQESLKRAARSTIQT
jgi:large subunit ribosomal protein L34e